MSDIDYPGDETPCLSLREGFDAVRHFLGSYWERGEHSSDDIAVLLGSMNGMEDGRPVDAAQWTDWLEAVGKAKVKRSATG